ncbi:MAG: hypothetical protein NBV63_00175 [Candidatus Pacebacteria bacterium]|nr:hypothetical protein [Candidatus Paceibacterota bacterium]
MKYFFALTLFVLASTGTAHAFAVVENAQCVGGTLVASHTDVIDGGGLAPYTNAKILVASDCSMLTPAGGCCSAKVSTNGGGKGGAVIPYTWFHYDIFTNATVQTGFAAGQTGPLANEAPFERAVGRQFKYFAGPGGGAAVPVTASLVANPTAIGSGEQALLSWSSTGAATCVGTNFSTNGATSGSVVTTPSATTRYSITCSAASATPRPTIIDMNADGGSYQSNAALITDMQQNGGVAFSSRYGIYSDSATTDRICKMVHGPNATQAGFDVTKYKSPKNNAIVKWDGTKWIAFGARSDNRKIRYVFKCSVPGTVSTTSGESATAHATVQVSAVNTLNVSCRAHPGRAGFNEDVLWSSTVSGPAGTYAYSWTGTDSLSGTGNQVFTRYTTPGEKKAWLTVTYTPGTTPPPAQAQQSIGGYEWKSTESSLEETCTGGGANFLPRCPSPLPACTAENVNTTCWNVQGSGSGECNPKLAAEFGLVTQVSCTAPSAGVLPPPPPTNPPSGAVLPKPSACPAIAWAVPITPCGGTWAPSYDAAGCQSGWQCVASEARRTEFYSQSTVLQKIQHVARIAEKAITNATILPAVYAQEACIPPGEYVVDSPNVTAQVALTLLDEPRCCSQTALTGGEYFNDIVCSGTGGVAGQCSAGQTAVAVFNPQGASCAGGSVVGRTSEVLDGVQIGMWPDGWLAGQCAELGAQAGDCCEYSQRASNNTGGGFPPNSYYQIRVIRGGSFSASESSYIQTPQCSGLNQNYSCSSVAGSVSTQCSGGPGDPPPPPPPPLGAQRVTVQCDNSVTVGTGEGEDTNQCTDGIDNDRDGRTDADDTNCANGGRSESGVTTQCSDGIDNNGDGTIDFPEDPWCASGNDNREAPDPIDMTLTGPALIKKNQSCTISLSARNVTSCTLSGPGLSQGFTAINGFVSASSVVTPALAQTSTYTLSCRGLDGKTAAKSVDCKVAPTFEEF